MTDVFDDLLDTWHQWDHVPGAEWAAKAMVTATNTAAHRLGCTSPELRRHLTAARRAGHDHANAIRSARNHFEKATAA